MDPVREQKALTIKKDLINATGTMLRAGIIPTAFIFSKDAADLLEEWVKSQTPASVLGAYSIDGGGPLFGYETRVNPYLHGMAIRFVLNLKNISSLPD